jgi:high-affinity nickel-transport protein
VSGTFLWIIGVLNLIVLLDIVRIFREMRLETDNEKVLEQRLLDRGFMSRFFLGRLAGRIRSSWHMYPLGVLFGLGFDTATRSGCSPSPRPSPPTTFRFWRSSRFRSCLQPACP